MALCLGPRRSKRCCRPPTTPCARSDSSRERRLDGRDGLDSLLTEGFAIESAGWKAAGGTAIVSRAETEGFYREVAAWAAQRGWLRLAFLRLDGRALAFEFAIEEGGVYYALKSGFDPAYRAFSPGTLLIHCTPFLYLVPGVE